VNEDTGTELRGVRADDQDATDVPTSTSRKGRRYARRTALWIVYCRAASW